MDKVALSMIIIMTCVSCSVVIWNGSMLQVLVLCKCIYIGLTNTLL